MIVLTAPERYSLSDFDNYVKVFMAGGITGCPDWQAQVINTLRAQEKSSGLKKNLLLFNPRRPEFDVRNVDEESRIQIEWEYQAMQDANYVFFWFPKEGKCMITLYELGVAIGANRSIRVGCHPEYERAFDVHTQLRLAQPELRVYDSLEELYQL